jgi:hypothetical protein
MVHALLPCTFTPLAKIGCTSIIILPSLSRWSLSQSFFITVLPSPGESRAGRGKRRLLTRSEIHCIVAELQRRAATTVATTCDDDNEDDEEFSSSTINNIAKKGKTNNNSPKKQEEKKVIDRMTSDGHNSAQSRREFIGLTTAITTTSIAATINPSKAYEAAFKSRTDDMQTISVSRQAKFDLVRRSFEMWLCLKLNS